MRRLRAYLVVLGPGLVTAFADNDAGGITTYSLAGAQFGFGLMWVLLVTAIALAGSMTAGQAIDKLRELQPEPESTYYLYVVDDQGRLDGIVSLRDLVVAQPAKKLSDIMDTHVLKVDVTTPKEDLAALMAKYDLLALPVVDSKRVLVGTVTVDDVVELILPRGWKKRSSRTIAR